MQYGHNIISIAAGAVFSFPPDMPIDPELRQQWQQTANRTTVFCLISLILGAYIIWVNSGNETMDKASALLPLFVVGFVHLLGGTIAVYNARRTQRPLRNIPVYGYFILAAVLAIWFVSGGTAVL
jgi:hypothetical protein